MKYPAALDALRAKQTTRQHSGLLLPKDPEHQRHQLSRSLQTQFARTVLLYTDSCSWYVALILHKNRHEFPVVLRQTNLPRFRVQKRLGSARKSGPYQVQLHLISFVHALGPIIRGQSGNMTSDTRMMRAKQYNFWFP